MHFHVRFPQDFLRARKEMSIFGQKNGGSTVGWNSGNEVFDPVARALVDLDASKSVKRKVLGTLIDHLQEQDWDTEDESMHEFRDDITIVVLFVERGVGSTLRGGDADGRIEHVEGEWVLNCSNCGRLATRPATLVDYDHIVGIWARHDKLQHRGTDATYDHMLLTRR